MSFARFHYKRSVDKVVVCLWPLVHFRAPIGFGFSSKYFRSLM